MTLSNIREAGEQWETARQAERQAREALTAAIRKAREQHSLAEIALELGVTRQRVEQLSKG